MRILKGTILLVFVCVFIRIAVGKPCVVPSGSMEPTLLCGDRLWINKLAYGGRLPKRWADIPLLNVFTWIRPLRIADEQNHWKYFRLPGFTQPQLGDIVVFNSNSHNQCSSEKDGSHSWEILWCSTALWMSAYGW